MQIKKYIEAIKELQKEGISEQIVIKVLEEWGKDRRTYMMESGKDKRIGNYPKKQEKTPQNGQNKATDTNKGQYGKPTKKMMYVMNHAWEHQDGQEFLREIGFDGDFDHLTYDKAKYYIGLIKDKEKQEKNQ
ncbi:MAG: hypothetical protein ACTSXD_07040 [Candidatus Heimdallarchaeaceae archaeon]